MQHKNYSCGSPSSTKEHEKERINPAYIDLSDVKKFQPSEDAVYLWVYTTNPDRIIVGIEEPWLYPQAFHAVNDVNFAETLKNIRGDHKGGLGHPTLAVKFTDSGIAEEGQAYIAGELFYNKKEKFWVINNKSGRFHTIQKDSEAIEELMAEVANRFQEVGLIVEIKILTKPLFNPAQMWKKAARHSNDLWHSDKISNVQLEALRIIIKHSNNSGISEFFKEKLHLIGVKIKSLVNGVRGDLTDDETSMVNETFKKLIDDLESLESNKKNLSELDKEILLAIQQQIAYIQNKLSGSNNNNEKISANNS